MKVILTLNYTKYLLFISFLFVFIPLFSADKTDDYLKNKPGESTLDKSKWEKLKKSYLYKAPKVEKKKKQTTKSTFSFSFGNAGWFKLLAYAVLFALIIAIFYLIIKFGFLNDEKLKNKGTEFNITQEPEDINALDIDPLLAEALKNQDFKLAIRLRFLSLLQLLNKKELILWKRNYTNQHYKQQLYSKAVYVHFNNLCLVYEKVWYGNYPINNEGYTNVNQKFNSLISQVNSN